MKFYYLFLIIIMTALLSSREALAQGASADAIITRNRAKKIENLAKATKSGIKNTSGMEDSTCIENMEFKFEISNTGSLYDLLTDESCDAIGSVVESMDGYIDSIVESASMGLLDTQNAEGAGGGTGAGGAVEESFALNLDNSTLDSSRFGGLSSYLGNTQLGDEAK